MYVLVERATRKVLDASNAVPWAVDPERSDVVDIAGADENTYAWPNGDRTRCLCSEAGEITGDPAWVDVDDLRDAYVAAKAAIVEFNATSTLATAKPAIIKLGVCVEELLKFLKHRIA